MQGVITIGRKYSVRQVIAAALLFMMPGTLIELYLLEHYEDWQQLIPLLCIGSALVLMGILFFRQTKVVTGLFLVAMLTTALSGVYGTILHLQANLEFEQEMKPTAQTWDLLVESLSGALPALAPASLIVLALIGYSYIILIRQRP